MKTKKWIVAILSLTLMLSLFAGCSSKESASEPSQAPEASQAPAVSQTPEASQSTTALQGTLSLSGSTSMEEVVNALAEAFMNEHTGVSVEPQFNGSGQGIKDAQEGKADIGNSSRELKAEETGLVPTTIAIDGIAIVVNPANTVKDITIEQLAAIYTGEIKNWSEVGGEDKPIVVVGRDAASGTRGAFEEIVKVKDACVYAQEKDSTGSVKTSVATDPGAIGYVSLEAADADDTVSKLMIGGVEATEENILAGSYTLSRPFIMVTKEGVQNELADAFIGFALSEEGQAIVADNKLITVQ